MIEIKWIYYIAALLEGEGCFGMYGKSPTIQIYMTDYEPISKLRSLMAPSIAIRIRKQNGHKSQYYLRFSGQLAIEWMMTLYPLFSPRRKEKIRVIIVEWKNLKINKYSVTVRRQHLKRVI